MSYGTSQLGKRNAGTSRLTVTLAGKLPDEVRYNRLRLSRRASAQTAVFLKLFLGAGEGI
jgi:hypothetical protein